MKAEEELRKSMQRFMMQPKQSRVCTVTAIDEENETIDAEPLDGGAAFFDVRLNAIVAGKQDAFILMPAVGSTVIITLIGNNDSEAYVSLATKFKWLRMQLSEDAFILVNADGKVDVKGVEISFNGSGNGGLIIIDNLKQQYDANLQALKTAISAGFTALSALDASASINAFNLSANAIQNLNKQGLENTKVKHG